VAEGPDNSGIDILRRAGNQTKLVKGPFLKGKQDDTNGIRFLIIKPCGGEAGGMENMAGMNESTACGGGKWELGDGEGEGERKRKEKSLKKTPKSKTEMGKS